MIQPIFNSIKFLVTAFVLTMGIVSSLSFGSLNVQAATNYTCPAGSTINGTNCVTLLCPDNSAPTAGNCNDNQYGLYPCNGNNGTQVMKPFYVGNNAYSQGLCTNRPETYKMGMCPGNATLGANMNEEISTTPVGQKDGAYYYAGLAGGMFNGVGANVNDVTKAETVFYSGGGDLYENIMNNYNNDTVQNQMCRLGTVTTAGNGQNWRTSDTAIEATYNNGEFARACPAGYGVFMIPTASKHMLPKMRDVSSLCIKYGTPTAGLKSIAYSTGYRPKTCNSIGFKDLYSTDLMGGDAEAVNLCIPNTPQPVSVVGRTVTTPATATSTTISNENVGVGNCGSGATTTQGTKVTCTFPLTGSVNGSYLIGKEGIFAGIRNTNGDMNSYLGDSNLCTVSGAILTCTDIPVPANTNLGARELVLHRPLVEWIANRGTITVTAKTSGASSSSTSTVTVTTSSSSANNSSSSSSSTTTTTVVTPDDFKPVITTGSSSSNNGSLIKITCNDGKETVINSTTTCTFDIGNKTLPADTKIAIGNGDINTSKCVANGSKVTCTNVSTGSEAGDQPIYIKIGNNDKVNTNQKVKVSGDTSPTATLVRSGAGSAIAGTAGVLAMATAGFFFFKHKTSRGAKMSI